MQDPSAAHQQHRRTDSRVAFVGREAEMHVLHDVLDSVLAGTGRVVLLSGEPGIGKTATAAQLANMARERGARVLWGYCNEWDGAPPYWPWTQILSSWLGELDDEGLAAALGPHASLLAQIVPGIQERLLELPPLPALEPEARHFHLLVAVATFVRAATEHRPLVIVLDDVHWADVPTLRLLLFLAQEIQYGQLLLVATYRDAELGRPHPRATILSDLARVPHSLHLTLRGLPKPQIARLVARITGRAQSPALVESLYAQTDGNPFFVTEVVRLLAEDGQLDGGRGPGYLAAHVPVSVREAIGRRLDRLSPACIRTLTLAAVIGQDVEVRLLAQASDLPTPQLLRALDEAVQAQFLRIEEAPGTYRFSHALVQEALYQEASAVERAQWHLAVARALEAISGPDMPWEELARHSYRASPLVEADTVALYAARAGNAAMAQFAWESAATHYQQALSSINQLPTDDIARRCDLLLMLGEAQNHSGSGAGDAPAARTTYFQAFELARQLGDGARMARAAVGFAGVNIVAAFAGRRQLELLEEALVALEPAETPLHVRVLARLAADLWHRSPKHLERSLSLADEGLAVAQRLDDPTLVAYALWAHHTSGHRPSNLTERLADAAQLVVAAEQTADPIAATWGQMLQLLDCIEAADLFGAQQAMIWLRNFSGRARIPYIEQRVAASEAMLALLTGDYAEAESQVERARSLWQSAAPRQHAAQSFLLQRDLGRLADVEEIQLPDHLHSWRRAAQAHRLALALACGQWDAARADYEDLGADDFARVRFDQHWFSTLAPLAEAAVAFADTSRAATLYAWLEPYAERLMVDGSLIVCHGPVTLYLGQLAGLLGRWDTAAQHLEQARSLCERLGLRPYLARTLLTQAQMLTRRDSRGDRMAASTLAQRAADTASAIGMLGLLPATLALQEELATSSDTGFGLTPRELEVLCLIAQGLTDAEVADQLFLSPRTVSTHLTSIYGKLGVSSRTAAARIAIEHGLS